MTCRVDTSPLLAGACVVSLFAGHGVAGAAVPSTGTHGPSPVYNDLVLPADAAKEYRWSITTPPAVGTLVVYEDCSYSYTPPGGTVNLTVGYSYRLWEDGVDLGTASETIVIGTGSSDTTAPTLTGSITVSALTSTSYTLTWPAGADNIAVASYERSLDGGSSWVDVGNVLTVNITGRTPGSTDAVRVRAKDAAGNVSTPALSASVNLPAGADTTPPTLAGPLTIGTVTSTSIGASWPAGSDNVAVSSYEVSTDGSSWTDVGNVLAHTFSGLTPSTSYTLRVRAKDAAGNVSSAIIATQSTGAAADTTPPTLAGTVTITGLTSTGYTASWPAGSDNVAVVSYERSLDGGSSWTDVGNVLTVTITGRTPSTTDLFRVRAKDSAGNTSTPVLGVSVTLPPASSGGLEGATPGYFIKAVIKGGVRTTVTVSNPGFSAKDPAERLIVGFDFSELTGAILAPAVTSTRHAGAEDPTPEALLDGAPGYVGPIALQRVWAGVDGTSYLLRCEVDDPDGNRFVLAGVLPVRAA